MSEWETKRGQRYKPKDHEVALLEKFKPGDQCLVLDDSADWDHSLQEGHPVRVVSVWSDEDYPSYEANGGFTNVGCQVIVLCKDRSCAPRNHAYIDNGDTRDIAVIDMEPVLVPVTDAELAQVYKSLGVNG